MENAQYEELNNKLSFFLEGTNGKGVMLVHGVTGAPAEMKLVAKGLNRKGYTVYAPLLAGHGVDQAMLGQHKWEDWFESVEAGAEKLRQHVDTVYAGGICMGGKLSMLLANKRPELVKAAAIYSPAFYFDGWNVPRYYAIFSPWTGVLAKIPFIDRLDNFKETPSVGIKDDRLRNMMLSLSAEGVIESFSAKNLIQMNRLGKALKNALPYMKTPTIIIHSKEDDLSNPRHAKYISKHIGAPHELHWVEDSYHMIHVDRSNKHVTELTANFFEKHAA